MRNKTAAWRKYMNDEDRKELDRAEVQKHKARDKYNAVLRKVKDRCIKRQRRDTKEQG